MIVHRAVRLTRCGRLTTQKRSFDDLLGFFPADCLAGLPQGILQGVVQVVLAKRATSVRSMLDSTGLHTENRMDSSLCAGDSDRRPPSPCTF